MRIAILILVMLGSCTSVLALDSSKLAQTGVETLNSEAEFAPGEILLRFTEEATQPQIEEILRSQGLEVLKTLLGGQIYHVRTSNAGAGVRQVLRSLQEHPLIRYAELNRIMRIPEPAGEELSSPWKRGSTRQTDQLSN
ncbi:MAG: hypothetical protein JW937_09795 [Candidatus Omnitrophica bacterium]|nr:hypothetical protein [Candidatus Omnitrophota bacterium]